MQGEMIFAADAGVGGSFDPDRLDQSAAAPGARVGVEKDAA
jgi:hypothetical protein